ncbi:MAG: DNA-3-methyladenine glycosylase [Parcubacteria group bacterium]|nr:DNA-3-methyladenine glycosylase [Parcubacteria group bacterium]
MKKLGRKFFTAPTLDISKDILGKFLVHKIGNKKFVGKIVETEAYIGIEDKASHAVGGKRTPRNEAEYLVGGHVYIYLVYGMYWQFNISTSTKDIPECFLIRAIEPVEGYPKNLTEKEIIKLANGPGKLCRWMGLDKTLYGVDVCNSDRIWVEDRGEVVKPSDVASGPRVGIDYAGEYWANVPWRFWIKNNKYVSK